MEEGQRKVWPRLRTYDLIEEAVSAGARYGLYRAYKHVERPEGLTDEEEARVLAEITHHVVSELCDVLTWDEEPEE